MSFDAYTVAIKLIHSLRELLPRSEKRDRDLTRRIRRAATSIALNLKEGNRRTGRDRTQHFKIAAGSADEILGALDVAVAWGYLNESLLGRARALLDRELAMLWRLTH